MGSDLYFVSSFENNAVIIIDGLRSTDAQTGFRLETYLLDLKNRHQEAVSIVERHKVNNIGELRNLLESLQKRGKEGLRPVLHFECHGDAKNGLEIGEARERIAWLTLEPLLRAINVASGCNLGVVMAVCAGLHAILPVKINRTTPFYFLVGSQVNLSQGQIEKEMPEFYRVLLLEGDLDAALRQVPSCLNYHAERTLAIALARFYRRACMGPGGQARAELLVTSVKWGLGGFKNREQMRWVRRRAKKQIRENMNAATFQRLSRPFLGQRRPSFTLEALLRWVRSGV